MSSTDRITGGGDTQYLKRKHDLGQEKDVLRKKKKKYSSSESEDSDDLSSSSSSSPSSSDSSSSSSKSHNEKRKKTKKNKHKLSKKEKKRKRKQKLKEKKLKKKLKKKFKKEKLESVIEDYGNDVGPVPLAGNQEVPDMSKRMAPMTKEEWEKKQSIVRRVFDEATGRHRLIKGDGEVLEEIVSRQRHQEINQQATQGDGTSFQNELALKIGFSNRK